MQNIQSQAKDIARLIGEIETEQSEQSPTIQPSTEQLSNENQGDSPQEARLRSYLADQTLNPNSGELSLIDEQMDDVWYTHPFYPGISNREYVADFQPKNTREQIAKQAILFRYDVEDFIDKHSEEIENCQKLRDFLNDMSDLIQNLSSIFLIACWII